MERENKGCLARLDIIAYCPSIKMQIRVAAKIAKQIGKNLPLRWIPRHTHSDAQRVSDSDKSLRWRDNPIVGTQYRSNDGMLGFATPHLSCPGAVVRAPSPEIAFLCVGRWYVVR